jgi:hypothetical protein
MFGMKESLCSLATRGFQVFTARYKIRSLLPTGRSEKMLDLFALERAHRRHHRPAAGAGGDIGAL